MWKSVKGLGCLGADCQKVELNYVDLQSTYYDVYIAIYIFLIITHNYCIPRAKVNLPCKPKLGYSDHEIR